MVREILQNTTAKAEGIALLTAPLLEKQEIIPQALQDSHRKIILCNALR
jgi:hypothetical protein